MSLPVDDQNIHLVVDKDTRRPACVLLQAMFSGTDPHIVSELFDPATWHTAPTGGFVVVNGTREQWEKHAARLNALVR